MVKKNKINYFILAYMLLFLVLFVPLSNFSFNYAYASDSYYTSVLSDLQKDTNFNKDLYPVIEGDYTLKVIQIAESYNNELFVYVYQPSCSLQASSINISTAINENLSYKNYTLSIIDSSGVFFKYLVNGLKVKQDALRYYDISSIFRKFDKSIDNDTGNDNTIDEVVFEVAQLWTACTVNGEVSYVRTVTEVVTITDKYVGFLRYPESFWLTGKSCDSHFVAFSTDYDIDDLYEVDISFVTRTYKMTYDTGLLLDDSGVASICSGSYTYEYGEYVDNNETLSSDEETEVYTGIIFVTKHTWSRIESVSTFMADEDLTTSTINNVSDKQWILRFYESDYKQWADSLGSVVIYEYETGTRVSEVTILSLKFETNEEVYKLGVIDNKQSGDDVPDNEQLTFWGKIWKAILNFLNTYWWILLIILLPLIIILLSCFKFIKNFLIFIGKILFKILQVVWWIITAPFSLF